MKISKVLADAGDAITIQASSNVWVDHCDLSSDQDHDKDYYDGLCDVTHGSDYVTISNTYFHVRPPSAPAQPFPWAYILTLKSCRTTGRLPWSDTATATATRTLVT